MASRINRVLRTAPVLLLLSLSLGACDAVMESASEPSTAASSSTCSYSVSIQGPSVVTAGAYAYYSLNIIENNDGEAVCTINNESITVASSTTPVQSCSAPSGQFCFLPSGVGTGTFTLQGHVRYLMNGAGQNYSYAPNRTITVVLPDS